jgi:hypothetical protein
VWVTTQCKACGRDGRHEVVIPDHRVQLQAVEKLLEQACGRPATAEPPVTAVLPRTPADVHAMSWDEMQYTFSLLHADELSEVARLGGRVALEGKLRGLSSAERQLLREAFAAVETPCS